MPEYHEALDSAFPAYTYGDTVRALQEGVALGDDVVKSIPFLDTPVGKDFRGLIRRAGVMFRIHQLCEAGDLPFVAEFTPMPIGSWHWLEISSGQCRGFLVRTPDKGAFPEDTPNQQDKRHSNQFEMFEDAKIVQLPKAKLYTAWLCYGATKNGAISHALWGLPSGKEAETWLARRDALNAVRMTIVRPEETKRPTVNPRDAMRFRDEIQEALEQQKGDIESGYEK